MAERGLRGTKRIGKAEISYGVTFLGPDEVEEILARAPALPRRTRRSILELTEKLVRAEVLIDGEAVAVRSDGTVLSGADKLYAVQQTGIGLPTVFAYGLIEGDLTVSSDFAKRTRADLLTAEGVDNPLLVSKAYNILDMLGRQGTYSMFATSTMPHEHLKHYQETLGDLQDEIVTCTAISARLIPRALSVVCHVILSQVDHDKAVDFFTEIGAASSDPEADVSAVVRLLVRTIRQWNADNAGVPHQRQVVLGFIFEAWHHYAAGNSPDKFSFEGVRAGRGYRNFPKIVGLESIPFPETKDPVTSLGDAEKLRLNQHYREMAENSPVRVSIDTISPPQARKALQTQNVSNRSPKPAYVERYRRMMRSGRWQLNGKTLKWAGGRLRDGQHRLMAATLENLTLTTFVVRNLDDAVFVGLDQQAKLALRDILQHAGFTNAQALASALSALSLFESLIDTKAVSGEGRNVAIRDLTFDEQRRLLVEHHPGLLDSAEMFGGKSFYRNLLSTGVVVVLHYIYRKQDRLLADEFFGQLKLELGVGRGNPDHNAQILRAALNRHGLSTGGRLLPAQRQVMLVSMAWEATRKGKRITVKSVLDAIKKPSEEVTVEALQAA